MMRRGYIYVVLAALLSLGCSDDSFRGTTDGMYGDGTNSIPVMVALGDLGGGVVKSAGAIDSVGEWGGRYIYVYAFRQGAGVSYTSMSRTDPFNCLVDGSRDNAASLAGKKARVEPNDAFLVWDIHDDRLVYPNDENRNGRYDFFAYYTDDAKVSYNRYDRNQGSVRLNVEINGSQDLMSSKAELTKTQLEQFTEKDRIFVKENAFGHYTAQRNIVPTFNFRHHLVRLEFELVSGLVRDEQKTVYVHSMSVESRYRAKFTVVDKDESSIGLEFEDSRKELLLTEDGKEHMRERTIKTRPLPDVEIANVKLGDCILLAPDMEYDAYMLMTEKNSDGTTVIERVRTPLDISYGGRQFEPGNQYKVKLTIYGATKVNVSVEMEPWRDGGKIEMDEEKDKPII